MARPVRPGTGTTHRTSEASQPGMQNGTLFADPIRASSPKSTASTGRTEDCSRPTPIRQISLAMRERIWVLDGEVATLLHIPREDFGLPTQRQMIQNFPTETCSSRPRPARARLIGRMKVFDYEMSASSSLTQRRQQAFRSLQICCPKTFHEMLKYRSQELVCPTDVPTRGQ